MLVILKRGGILFLALLVIVSFLIFTLRREPSVETAAENTDIIVIDAGHGAPDGGARGVNTGILEKDINLAISGKLSEKLRANGETVLETRTSDEGLYTSEDASLRDKKREDMKERVRLSKESGVSLFISIHQNHFTDPKYSGPQIFYQKGSEEGKRLAEEIRASFLSTIGPHCTRETKPTGDLYILRQTKVPAVIIECGFLSNPEEEVLLMDEAYQNKLADAICLGIENFKNGV